MSADEVDEALDQLTDTARREDWDGHKAGGWGQVVSDELARLRADLSRTTTALDAALHRHGDVLAELAETRAAGNEMRAALAEWQPRLLYSDRLRTATEAWRSVRGDAPAPAEPPADPRCTCGDPTAVGVVHYAQAPCRYVEELFGERAQVPVEAASWLVQALEDPHAVRGHVTDRAAAAVFAMVRRYDATGKGWGGERSAEDQAPPDGEDDDLDGGFPDEQRLDDWAEQTGVDLHAKWRHDGVLYARDYAGRQYMVPGESWPVPVSTPVSDPQPVNAELRDRLRSYPGDRSHQTPADEPDGLPYVVALRMDDGSAGGLWSTESFATVEAAEEAARNAGRDRAVYRLAPVSSPPAVDLPVTLSSVDDVAAVAEAHGLTVRSSGPGWTQWRDPETKAVVRCEAWQSGVERVTVAGRAGADVYRPVARRTVVAAIEAARGGSR